jgi:hypothetical protein
MKYLKLDSINSSKFYYREARSVPSEWLLTVIMTSVGSIASNICVKVHETYIEPIFLYLIIIGLPGTKKTYAIKFIKHEILALIKQHPDSIHFNNSQYMY